MADSSQHTSHVRTLTSVGFQDRQAKAVVKTVESMINETTVKPSLNFSPEKFLMEHQLTLRQMEHRMMTRTAWTVFVIVAAVIFMAVVAIKTIS